MCGLVQHLHSPAASFPGSPTPEHKHCNQEDGSVKSRKGGRKTLYASEHTWRLRTVTVKIQRTKVLGSSRQLTNIP